MNPIAVGLIDSGVNPDAGILVASEMAFWLDETGTVVSGPVSGDRSGHGTSLARIIGGLAPDVAILDAQVFKGPSPSSAAAVAAGLDWVVERGAQVVNMSFGLRADRAILRVACARAADRGVVMVASVPARGLPVYPASYPGVVRVSGDARCGSGEYSWLGGDGVDFGACVGGLSHKPHAPGGGASLAVAHVVGYFAKCLQSGADAAHVFDDLTRRCAYRGPERRV